DLLPSLIDGSTRATVAWDLDSVVDGQIADGLVAVQDGKAAWFERASFEATPHGTTDGTRRTASVSLEGSGRELGPATELEFGMEPGTARAIDTMAVLLSAEMVAAMQWALDTTVQYVKDRLAFGRPI